MEFHGRKFAGFNSTLTQFEPRRRGKHVGKPPRNARSTLPRRFFRRLRVSVVPRIPAVPRRSAAHPGRGGAVRFPGRTAAAGGVPQAPRPPSAGRAGSRPAPPPAHRPPLPARVPRHTGRQASRAGRPRSSPPSRRREASSAECGRPPVGPGGPGSRRSRTPKASGSIPSGGSSRTTDQRPDSGGPEVARKAHRSRRKPGSSGREELERGPLRAPRLRGESLRILDAGPHRYFAGAQRAARYAFRRRIPSSRVSSRFA